MTVKVLDSWAVLAFYKGEPAGAEVEKLIEAASVSGKPLLLSAVNWAEVYYSMERAGGRPVAEQAVADLATLPIDVVGVGDDLKLTRLAAQFKARFKLSLADAFAAALAKERKAELVTGDPEFKALEKEIKVAWLAHTR
jgi:predicted nucleic acid-binding protein